MKGNKNSGQKELEHIAALAQEESLIRGKARRLALKIREIAPQSSCHRVFDCLDLSNLPTYDLYRYVSIGSTIVFSDGGKASSGLVEVFFFRTLDPKTCANLSMLWETDFRLIPGESEEVNLVTRIGYGHRVKDQPNEVTTTFEYFGLDVGTKETREIEEAYRFVSELVDKLKVSTFREVSSDHPLLNPDGPVCPIFLKRIEGNTLDEGNDNGPAR